MGHEMLHGTSLWAGRSRICIVNALHQIILNRQDWPINAEGVKENPNRPHKSAMEQLSLEEQASEPEQSDDSHSEDPDPEDEPGNYPTAESSQPKRPLADNDYDTDSADDRPSKRIRRLVAD